jgi:hypothetical protein
MDSIQQHLEWTGVDQGGGSTFKGGEEGSLGFKGWLRLITGAAGLC